MKSLNASSFNLLWEYKDDIPLKLKENKQFWTRYSKKLYKDFQTLELSFWKYCKTLGNGTFSLICIKWWGFKPTNTSCLTQKLCDRIIFILFAEDRDF